MRKQTINTKWQCYNSHIIHGHRIPLNSSSCSQHGHPYRVPQTTNRVQRGKTQSEMNCSITAAEKILHALPQQLCSPPSEISPPPPIRQGKFILKHKSEDAAVVHINTAFINAQLLGTTQMQPSTSGETKWLFTRLGRGKDLLFPEATLKISGRAARGVYPASPHPLSYAPSKPLFHTVMAQDRDTFLPACRTLLLGWSHAECTRYSSCCPQGASPGNRIWASESTQLQWLFISPSWAWWISLVHEPTTALSVLCMLS